MPTVAMKSLGAGVASMIVLTVMAACSSPAERHMKRALCAGRGAVTNAEFAECYRQVAAEKRETK